MDPRATVLQTVFKKNINQSFLQIQHNKINKKEKIDQDALDQEKSIEKNVDDRTARLSRFYPTNKNMITIKKQGMLYTKAQAQSFFACFTCSGRQGKRVVIQNRVITVRDKGGRIIETVNCDTASLKVETGDKSVKLTVKADSTDNQKTFYFQATPQQSIKEWREAFEKSMNNSLGTLNQLRYLTTVPEYWNTLSITQMQFSRKCNTGDILLFKSSHGTAKLQRGFTGSNYDHIAMVLRNQKNQVMIFESSSDSGVALTFWKDLVKYKWYDATERITYRELKVERSQQFLSKVEAFTVDNLDKKFSCSLGKLLTFKSALMTKQEEKNRTFFCSQLIAKCYKEVGLLNSQKASSQYWPLNFTQDGSLDLLKGQLGPEQLICFDQQICNSY